MKKFKNKKCVITGAASGIGRATAIAMGNLGANLFLTDINSEGLKNTAQTIRNYGGVVSLIKAFDISNFEDVKAFADEIHKGTPYAQNVMKRCISPSLSRNSPLFLEELREFSPLL